MMIKNLDINERILHIIDNQCSGNQKKFAEIIGFAPQVVSNIVSGRKSKPSFDVLNAISSSFVDINSFWLLTGEGPMLRNNTDSGFITEPTPSFRKTSDPIKDIQRIPLFNSMATMGLLPKSNGDFDDEYIVDYLSVPNLPSVDGAIYATGDSMYPLLKAGDIIAFKKVEVDVDNIFFGEIYILSIYIDNHSTYKTIKFLQKSEKGDGYVKLVSQNQHHQDKDIPVEKIAAMALVRASIRIHN